MRTIVTFILRLWIDPEADEPAWEGQVECVGNELRAHVRSSAELTRFVEAQAAEARLDHAPLHRNG